MKPNEVETDLLWRAWEKPDDPIVMNSVEPSLLATIRRLRAIPHAQPDPARMWTIRTDLLDFPGPAPVRLPIRDGREHAAIRVERPIRVVIVERDALIRRGLVGCLDGDDATEVIAMATTAGDGYRLVGDHLPDVVLVGTTLADAPGLDAATTFRQRFPAIATIVMAAQERDDELFAAIRAGAAAYCGQDIDEIQLIQLVRRAAVGEYVINEQLLAKPDVASRVLAAFRSRTASDIAPTSPFAPLTERELEILKKVSDGLTNAEIGFALGISAQTTKNHVTSILRKLSVNDRTHAVVTALKRGWISIDDDPLSPKAGTPDDDTAGEPQ